MPLERKDHVLTEPTVIQMIPVESISPSPLNPRSIHASCLSSEHTQRNQFLRTSSEGCY